MATQFVKLTRPAIRALLRGKRIMEHGIIFERLPTGDGLFSVNIMVDRQRIHRTIGRESDGTTRRTCEEFVAKVRIEARENRLNLPKRRKVPMTVAGAVPAYIERLRHEGGREIERKKQRLGEYLAPFFGTLLLSQITSFDIERYKKHRLGQPAFTRKKLPAGVIPPTNKPATINRELATLSHLLNKAVEWNWIERSSAKIRRLGEDNRRITYLSPGQAEALLEAAKQDQNRQIYPFILIGLRTAMRSRRSFRSGAATST